MICQTCNKAMLTERPHIHANIGNTCTCPNSPMPGHYVGCPLAGAASLDGLLDAIRAYGDARADVAYGRATRTAIDLSWDRLLTVARIPPMDQRATQALPVPALSDAERFGDTVMAALRLRLVHGATDATYTPREVAKMVRHVIEKQVAALREEETP